MATYPFRLLNVFTVRGTPLSGNPLCVFESAGALSGEAMQALALQFNLSETTFILPSQRADARVRIFTPTYEMPFAGHPTLGTAYVCRALGLAGDTLTLEMQAGLIGVTARGDHWTLTANAPTWHPPRIPRPRIAAMLGLDAADVGERPLWVDTGSRQLVVPLVSEAAVRRAQPQPGPWSELDGPAGQGMALAFASREASGPARPGASPAATPILSRFFFQQHGGAILEDPATGSAAANLGGWQLATGRALPARFEISQGEYVGRPSILDLEIDAGRRIAVGGDVVELGRGTLDL